MGINSVKAITCINDFFSQTPYGFLIRTMSTQEWLQITESISYCPTFYSHSFLEYEEIRNSVLGNQSMDLSIIIYKQNNPICLFPLRFTEFRETRELMMLKPIILSNAESIEKINRICLQLTNALGTQFSINSFRSEIMFEGMQNSFISNWHKLLMNEKFQVNLGHEILVNLSLTESEYWSCIRDSYKSYINKGLKEYDVKVMSHSNYNSDLWANYINLHEKVSMKSKDNMVWKFLRDELLMNRGILITTRFGNGELIGGSYITMTKNEAIYGLGSSLRFENLPPVSHVMQYIAINYLREIGIKWYKLGLRNFHGEIDNPDKKLQSIGFFKEGFASELSPKYMFSRSIRNS